MGPSRNCKKKLTQFPYVSHSLSLHSRKLQQDHQFYKLIKSDSTPATMSVLNFTSLSKKNAFTIYSTNITKYLLCIHKRVLFLLFSVRKIPTFCKGDLVMVFNTHPFPIPSLPMKQIANKRCMLDMLSAFRFPDNTAT